MRYKFTDKEMKKILDNMTVVVDSREQNNQHILDFFNKKKIPYKTVKNDFGDYTAMIPKGTIGQFTTDIYFDRDIAIERKNSIDEIAGNLKEDAARLKKELAHMNMHDIKYFFFVEDKDFHENLRNGNYRSQYDPFTLMQRIKKGIEAEYNTVIVPVDKKCMGSEIYYTLQAYVYNLFKHKGFILESEVDEVE
ncbi:ERCC4 domain-containing protein [Clostridium botulinum]|uniref:ERCC4 domain-containing protein n=1 Tax=Clostridium botulinum TaxID=1491 RepID=UPI001C9BB51F|nr:ERCC4 domain-containing protein [Clostridium botulinum]MBY6948397.1 ERCC4 domain-containing protein [Clostridium botulinum]MBY7021390.1 ERCC4 domain-containing protein [Clostridium botulinum]